MKTNSINSEKLLHMASSNSKIHKPQRGHPKRTELPDVNILTWAQKALILRVSYFKCMMWPQ